MMNFYLVLLWVLIFLTAFDNISVFSVPSVADFSNGDL